MARHNVCTLACTVVVLRYLGLRVCRMSIFAPVQQHLGSINSLLFSLHKRTTSVELSSGCVSCSPPPLPFNRLSNSFELNFIHQFYSRGIKEGFGIEISKSYDFFHSRKRRLKTENGWLLNIVASISCLRRGIIRRAIAILRNERLNEFQRSHGLCVV